MLLHEKLIFDAVSKYVSEKYTIPQSDINLVFQQTRKEFEGDITLVIFGLTKLLKKSPPQVGDEMTALLKEIIFEGQPLLKGTQLVQGFLNISLSDAYWLWSLRTHSLNLPATGKKTVVEYSSPNTNKPLHLGHIRNNLLGDSVSRIIEAAGDELVKVQIINDRGIHICKSMLAWQKFGKGESPESSGLKGDHLVGKYYVAYDKAYRADVAALLAAGMAEAEAKAKAPILLEAQEMLRKWEAGDTEIIALWEKMNSWVYAGFNATYSRLGVSFDKNYYESQTYLLGKDKVLQGLQQGVFFQKEDGSVWADLSAEKLDQKVVLRSDGTSVYMTQDIGTAIERYNEWQMDNMIYVVGNEQDYHFKVLFHILQKLGYDWAQRCFHLSYGMVDLPSGKMKSREGTVVDADDLIEEVVAGARQKTLELGKFDALSEAAAADLFEQIGLGALKYFILKVDPQKRMLFNPDESIDLNGNTGPFIQYSHARICSILRKAEARGIPLTQRHAVNASELVAAERELIILLTAYKQVVLEARQKLSPAVICQYAYDLATAFNRFYHDCSILNEAQAETQAFRLSLAAHTAEVLKRSLHLIGVAAPEKM
ncbi:MAG: arginine--tRNA ligase [Bacteroidia bacterium]